MAAPAPRTPGAPGPRAARTAAPLGSAPSSATPLGAALFASALLAAALLLSGCGKLFPQRSEGERLYVENCADCHGMDGHGNTARCMGQAYADLTDDNWKNGGDDTSVANSIRDGSFGLMPAFQQKLDDQQIEALVAYIRVLHKRAGGGSP